MENFLIKLWKLGTSVIFFSLASLLSFFLDPPSSACQQGSLQGASRRKLLSPALSIYSRGLSLLQGSRPAGRPSPSTLSLRSGVGTLQPSSFQGPAGLGTQPIKSHSDVMETGCVCQTMALELLGWKNWDSAALPHKSHPPPLSVLSQKNWAVPLVLENYCSR